MKFAARISEDNTAAKAMRNDVLAAKICGIDPPAINATTYVRDERTNCREYAEILHEIPCG